MIGILGGGLSGVALAAYLRQPCVVIEAEPELGGLCRTVTTPEGYSYDLGPHILFSRDRELLDEMTSVLGDNWHERPRENRILLVDQLVGWPLENHLGDLPPEVRARCLIGYLNRPHGIETPSRSRHLEQWCRAAFGDAIADLYLLPYNRKLWKREPSELASDWCGRVPQPPIEDVVRGACQVPTVGHQHQAVFRYPKRGGIAALIEGYRKRWHPETEALLDVHPRHIIREDGEWYIELGEGDGIRHGVHCDQLVSTIPLEAMLRMLPYVPSEVAEAAYQLEWLDVLIQGPEHPTRYKRETAVYMPDAGEVAHRLYCPMQFSESSGPRPFWCAEVTVPHGVASEHTGLRVPYAYPVPTLATASARDVVLGYLAGLGIRCIGRAGTHSYLNCDACVRDARALAEELNR